MIYKSKTHKYRIKIQWMPDVYSYVEGVCIFRKEIGWKNFFKMWEQTNHWSSRDDWEWAKRKIQQMIETDNLV